MKNIKLFYTNNERTWSGLLLAAILTCAIAAAPAHAAMISFFLDKNNAGLPNDDYLQVTISTSNNGDIDFQVDVLSGAFPNPGENFGMDKFFFNYDDINLDVKMSNIVNLDPSTWSVHLDKNAGGGFGKFEIQTKGNGNSRTELLTFSITDVDNDNPWTYAIGNPDEGTEFFAAHVGDFDGQESAQFAGSTLVPIPSTVWIFGAGLIGLVGIRRKFLPNIS